jgi:hypothetical protein
VTTGSARAHAMRLAHGRGAWRADATRVVRMLHGRRTANGSPPTRDGSDDLDLR